MAKQKLVILISLLAIIASLFATPAVAQAELSLTVRRRSGLGLINRVRSNLSLSVSGPEDLQSVTFLIDDHVLKEITSPPFVYTFHTDQFDAGWYDLSAVGQTSSGDTITSNIARYQFLSREEANRILVPIAVIVLILIAGTMYARSGGFRQKRKFVALGTVRKYGLGGGTICPRCGRPFPFHALSINVLFGILDMCEHCGRWGIFKRSAADQLHQAEIDEVERAKPQDPIQGSSPEKRLSQEIEASRFEDIE